MSPTFKTFVDDSWLPTYPASAANRRTTIKEKKTHVRVHLAPFFGETRLNEIDRLMLDQFVAEMFEKTVGKDPSTRTSRNGKLDAPRPLSAKRIKNVMGTLRTILGTAHRWGVLEKLPDFPQIKTVAPTFDFYDATEAALLVASAREDERVLVLFALHTGARAGELLALEWTDVDLRAQQLVSFSKSRSDGFTTNGTKSGKPRKVPLSPTLAAALKAHRHMRGPLVFCQDDGTALTLWHLHGALERATRRANLRLLRWHDLRHSFASNLTIGGTPIRQVQEWMGHATITMTMRYSHLAPGGGREFLAALEGGVPTPARVVASA